MHKDFNDISLNDNMENRRRLTIPSSKNELYNNSKSFGEKVIAGFNSSPTAYHLVKWSKDLLLANDFEELKENKVWSLQAGKKYFLSRDKSSIIIISLGDLIDIKNTAFAIIGGHTDSPTLRFDPNSYQLDSTFDKYNLQLYGGGQWQTWFDRDLSAAGKICFTKDGKLRTELFNLEKPFFFIPNLCIHLRKDKEGFNWNNEDNLKAITSTSFYDDLFQDKKSDDELTDFEKKVGKKLAQKISQIFGVNPKDVFEYNVVLYDTNKACFVGLNQEFIATERFDNQGTSITATYSMIESSKNLQNTKTINIATLFDSEEIGSLTYQGANSSFFKDILIRIYSSIKTTTGGFGDINQLDFYNYFQATCSRSFLLSTDMAHLYHPNYSSFYHNLHKPLPHLGPVIKTNAGGKYSTEAEGATLVKFIAKKYKIPIQEFIVRQDLPCGTTIGPIIAGQCGIRSVDLGCPQLAMHSIREQTAITDIYYLKEFFNAYYTEYFDSLGELFDQ